MSTVHCFSQREARIDLILSDTGQFSAEGCKFRVDCGLHIGLELTYYLLLFDINDHHGKFDDLVEGQIFRLIFTLAFEIVNNNEIKGSLIDKFSILDI